MAAEIVLYESDGKVGIVTLNRPDKLNALSMDLRLAIEQVLRRADEDSATSVIVLRGAGRAFCVGFDVGGGGGAHPWRHDALKYHERLSTSFRCLMTPWMLRKPVISSVQGYALGGGCELAMMCDMIIAADNAKFGQPEIKLGVIPGIGGTQRLTRAVGKAKAMDLNLTGRMMDAAEAERSGLVARVVPAATLMDEVMKVAETIAGMSLVALMVAKESVNRAFETTLAEGIRFERRTFHALFATHDQKEGMAAFVEKRPAKFEDR